ncbi:MAG TPA: cytochrome b/b6 domain-containing protein [Lapillicoccus sp.]
MGFGVPAIENFTPYDALQKLMSFTVVFLAAPLMMATGPAMSPAVVGRFPWYPKLFGTRQAARSIHFLGMAFLVFFTVMHIVLVFVVHPDHNLPQMILGVNDPARFAQALTVCLMGIAVVVAAWLAISYLSLVDIRKTQNFLFTLLEPIRAITVNRMASRTRRAGTYTDKDISPYHWSNGRYPGPEESPEWTTMAQNDFRDYVLAIGGLTSNSVRVTFAELKALPQQEQISMHTCMQGWTGIAKWKGPRVMDVMALAGERDPARSTSW